MEKRFGKVTLDLEEIVKTNFGHNIDEYSSVVVKGSYLQIDRIENINYKEKYCYLHNHGQQKYEFSELLVIDSSWEEIEDANDSINYGYDSSKIYLPMKYDIVEAFGTKVMVAEDPDFYSEGVNVWTTFNNKLCFLEFKDMGEIQRKTDEAEEIRQYFNDFRPEVLLYERIAKLENKVDLMEDYFSSRDKEKAQEISSLQQEVSIFKNSYKETRELSKIKEERINERLHNLEDRILPKWLGEVRIGAF